MLKISTNIDKFITNIGPQYKKALQKAKNKANYNTAKLVSTILVDEMKKVFDRPTPWTLRGIEAIYPKDNGPAIVRVKEYAGKGIPAVKFLYAEVHGGGRALKSFEKRLLEKGILPEGYIIVPGKSAKLDQYGNVSAGLLIQITSILQAFPSDSFMNTSQESLKRNKKIAKLATSVFIVNKPGNRLHMGIYQRDSQNKLRILLAFVKKANYKERFKFFDVSIANAKIIYPMQYPDALANELSKIKLI